MSMEPKKPKVVEIWKNGCGANVGKHVIHFTGITEDDIGLGFRQLKKPKRDSGKKPKREGVYVTLKYPVWVFPSLFYISDRKVATLREVIRIAKSKRSKGFAMRRYGRSGVREAG